MTKMDWSVLGIVLASIVSISLGAIALSSKAKQRTFFFDLHRESKPHKVTSRHEDLQQHQDMELGLKVDGPLVVLKNTSEIEILFSRSETTNLQSFNHSEKIPEIHY